MGSIDLVDETFVRVDRAVVAEALHQRERWARWWPDLELRVFQDRGLQGIRWSVTGALVGSMEVWLEDYRTGTILHHYLRADPSDPHDRRTAGALPPRQTARLLDARARSGKAAFWLLKDELERAGR